MHAGLWLRLKAFVFDYVLIFSYMVVLVIVSVFFIPSEQEWFQGSRIIAQLTGFILLTLPVSFYFDGYFHKNKQTLYDWLTKTYILK